MIYKSCDYIEGGIAFRPKAIALCNSWNAVMSPDDVQLFYSNKNSNKFNSELFEEFNKIRLNIKKKAKKNIFPYNECQSCTLLSEKDWDTSDKIKEIQIGHWLHCNCGCIYCCNLNASKGIITQKKQNNTNFELYPLMKKIYKENLIATDAYFIFNGGECTILKEFSEIMKLILKQKNTNYSYNFNSNGIIYSKYISKALNSVNNPKRNTYLCISIDAGTRKTYKRIKRVDKFDNVIETQKKYVKDLKNYPDRIISKYIIIKNLNDNKEEIISWIENCEKIGIKMLQPSLDYAVNIKNKRDIDPKISDLYNFIKEECHKRGLEYMLINDIEKYINNGNYLI